MLAELGDVWVRQELLAGAPEDTHCMGCDVDVGDLLSGLFFARGEGVETGFDWVRLGGQHRISHWILDGDDEVCILGGGALLGMRDDERSVRGSSKDIGGMGV